MPLLPTALLLTTLLSPPADRFTWPLPPPHPVMRAFEAPASPFGPGHRGVDLASPAGTPVLAAGDATVVFAGAVAARTLVSLQHRNGLRTTYEPIAPAVTAGRPVRRGEVIGHLQAGHCPTPCLHWGARRGQAYLDPLRLVSSGRVRLLPLAAPT
ncbi:M23 family metallopeptidase [Lentzea albidocapillata]|uniref:Peptidase family M23 n=1 Tax=Lentzea albidocapillata TaxID=40571 RepID=A0A1W2DZY6_9PSEU|nr:M23 family metallopeptidase [Lentzea albidocapillata]SMD03053.1 Peptidase family M23 [Lentzea albidocapillata]